MGAIGRVLLSPATALVRSMVKPKAKAAPVQPLARPEAQPPRTTALLDSMAQRRGSRANQRVGRLGGEPTGGGSKTSLGA